MGDEADSAESQLMRLASKRNAAPPAAYCCRKQLGCSCIATTVSMLYIDAAIQIVLNNVKDLHCLKLKPCWLL
jgi:hypothetical protein